MIAPTFRIKGSSSDEIIFHTVTKINGSESTLEKTIAQFALFAWDKRTLFGNYLDSLLLSDFSL